MSKIDQLKAKLESEKEPPKAIVKSSDPIVELERLVEESIKPEIMESRKLEIREETQKAGNPENITSDNKTIQNERDYLRSLLLSRQETKKKLSTVVLLRQELEINRIQLVFKEQTARKISTERIIQEALDMYLPVLKKKLEDSAE